MGATLKHHLKAGLPFPTHGHRSTWCEKKVRLLALLFLIKKTLTVTKKCVCVCVCEGVEKPFVKFYEVCFIHVEQFFFSLPQGNVAR